MMSVSQDTERLDFYHFRQAVGQSESAVRSALKALGLRPEYGADDARERRYPVEWIPTVQAEIERQRG